ncbi:hypothetical protein E1B28_008143 [Marasmius oreades]|uniref:O-methyltransferase C-terminal domain-containing protein n=1 Tax=Marasmius oreades TaxID=181124 RepID=A0A9P7URG4_9AGAR|nr:uncharacterized protein E1B28_008143 [Marasmius oreades]KAG7091742.1 hypothetical protein E1B28_008143 [Marasmius oreades]
MSSDASPRTQIEALLSLISSSTQAAMSEYEKTGHGIPTPNSSKSHPLDNEAGALALRRAIRTLEAACERLCTTLAQPMHTLHNRAMPYEAPCLKVVVEEGIADILESTASNNAKGMHIDDIATKTKNKVDPEKLNQMMLLLSTRGCFQEVSKDVYANNRMSLQLLSSNPMSSTVALYSGEILQGASMLPEALVHPEYASSRAVNRSSFSYLIRNEMENASYFDWVQSNPHSIKRFQLAMKGLSSSVGSSDAVVQVYPWKELLKSSLASGKHSLTFCDVGSGPGAIALQLSKSHNKKFKVVLQDLPEPLEHAKTIWSVEHPGGDVQFVPVDFLKESPVPGQDVYFLGYIIHDWPDSDAVTILKNIASVMNSSSRLLLHDYVLQHLYRDQSSTESNVEMAPEPLLPNYGSGNVRAYNHSITMLALFNSRERTRDDFVALGRQSGLILVKIWPLSETCLVEFRLASPRLAAL